MASDRPAEVFESQGVQGLTKTLYQRLNLAIDKVERSNADGAGSTGIQILALQELVLLQADIIKTLIEATELDAT